MDSYTTIQGETWDQIALKVYGSETHFHNLVQANHLHKETLFFESGLVLKVPPIEARRNVEVPRWKER